jgi:uncharacterized SAM-binding protein YcdF (DUF218 family)
MAIRSTPLRFVRFLLLAFTAWLLIALVLSITIHVYGQTDRAITITSADAIFVLGPALERRIDRAHELWRAGYAPILVCSGGKENDETVTQAELCRDMLVEREIPSEAVMVEDVSVSTEENAIYAQTLIAEYGWETVIIVSDDYHLLRADWMFTRMGINSYSSPASTRELSPRGYLVALFREVAAFHWQVFIDLFNLPVTRVEGI